MPLDVLARQHETVVNLNLRKGVFPGSFNPLTIAHLEVARRARIDHALDEVHLVVSEVALDKPAPPGPSFAERISLLKADAAEFDWLHVATTTEQLIVDIASGYDVVIMGADKWRQVNDVRYYASEAHRDDAVERLPEVVVAPRSGDHVPDDLRLETSAEIHDISSTRARAGDRTVMAPHAAAKWADGPVIRRCEDSEGALAAEIYLESRRAAAPAVPPSIHPDDDVVRWFTQHLMQTADVWLAEINDVPIAVLAFTNGWLDQLYVLPDHYNRGIGSALVRHAQSIQTQLDLWTFQRNEGAQRFYERHGFVEIERTDGDNEEGAPDIRYRWRADRG